MRRVTLALVGVRRNPLWRVGDVAHGLDNQLLPQCECGAALKHPQPPFLAYALTGCIARVAQVWCSSLVDAAGFVDAPTSCLWACGRGPLLVSESSVFVHRVVRPRSGTKYYRLCHGCVQATRPLCPLLLLLCWTC